MTNKSMKAGPVAAFKAACRTWLGLPPGSGDGTGYNLGERIPPMLSGQCVSERSVLQLSAAWACVTFLCDTISTLPLGFYRRTPTGRISAREHPLARVLSRQPNADQTAAQFWGAVTASLVLRGVAYVEKQMSAGYVIGHKFLHPDRTQRVRLQNGSWEYRVTENGKTRTLPESRVMRILGFSLDGDTPVSAIRYGAQVFGNAQAAEAAAATTFDKGLMPTTVFTYPTVLKETQRDLARESIKKISGAVNAGEPVIVEAGVTVSGLGINPVDAQLLESRSFSVEEICSWFRMQPWMIGRSSKGQTNWGTGLEQQQIGFVTYTLLPTLRRIEQCIEKDDLRPEEKGEYYAEFAIEGLMRGDSSARSAFYASALQNGYMNRSYVASLENFPPIPGGDIFTVQSNLVPLDQLGKTNSAAGARAALLNWLQPEDSSRAS